jgi:ZIP family zinc transporter
MWEIIGISALAGLATGLGAIIVMVLGMPSASLLSVVLGFAAGIMLAISAFDLLPEALALGGSVRAVLGFLLGAGLMFLLDTLVPHLHIGSGQGERSGRQQELLKTGYFIFLGIALHNLPEGLAIGAGFTASQRLGAAIAIALALHNVPEGMATAAPLLGGGMGKGKTIALTTLAGLMTPVGTLAGAALFSISRGFVGIALALAAGAMVYIVSDELIPQSHVFHSHMANAGLLAGFLLGMLI